MRLTRNWLLLLSFWSLWIGGYTQSQPPYLIDAAVLFAYDKGLPLSPEEKLEEEANGYKVYKVTYRSVHDQRVPAFLVLPTGKEGEKLPCVILMHGLGGDKAMFKPFWGILINAGYALLAIDAQYHGERKSKEPLELFGVYPYYSRDALIQTVIDLRRAIDYLETRKEIDSKRIGYLGASMGGVLGSIFAGVDPRVQAPILMVAGGNWKLIMGKSTLPIWQRALKEFPERIPEALQALEPVDPIHWVGRITPRPVLFINGDADDVVPVPSNKALHEAAKEPKQILWYKGGHVPQGDQLPIVLQAIQNWLETHLKKETK